MEAIKRVESMEKIFNQQLALTDSLISLLAEVENSQGDFDKLLDYYGSQTYMRDLDLAAQGYFEGVPCGVLSEDGVYNLLFERRNMAEKLKAMAERLKLVK